MLLNVHNENILVLSADKYHNIRDMLFEDLISYHQNVKLTVEMNPSNFLIQN